MRLVEFIEDATGALSMKRIAFLWFIGVFTGLIGLVLTRALAADQLAFATASLDKTKDIIEWLGAFIMGEAAATAIAKKLP